MSKDTHIEAHNVPVTILPKVTRLMNDTTSESWFSQRVIDIIPTPRGPEWRVVIVEIRGSYPFMERRWRDLLT